MKKRIAAIAMFAVLIGIAGPAAFGAGQEEPALRKEIVRLKYIDATDVRILLQPFSSRGGQVMGSPNRKDILTIVDTSDNVARMLDVIREIDVKPPDVMFTVQLIMGSESDVTVDKDLAKDPVIQELGKLLRYKGYSLLDATVLRGVDRQRSGLILGPKADFELFLRPEIVREKPQDAVKIEIILHHFTHPEEAFFEGKPVQGRQKSLITSTVNIRSGDRTVVGASRLDGGDKGLILIISAKTIY
ncbi:MAG: hypothetical protein SCM96_12985 [Acidobacteriota bacterium]|nr:hypothetical protein [Acidobacteriota bacterium]